MYSLGLLKFLQCVQVNPFFKFVTYSYNLKSISEIWVYFGLFLVWFLINSRQNVEQGLFFMNLEDIGPILETKDMGVIFEGRKVEKCVNEETLTKDCQNQWNIVIFEKEKLS